jgi:hypothetical protein
MRNALLILFMIGFGVQPIAVASSKQAQLRSLDAQGPKVIIRGSYLGKVEVWAVPTGTGITPDEYTLLGHAKRKTAAGRNEEWRFEVDCGSLLATRVFVTAFNRKGKNIGAKSLHYAGASEISEALCSGQ